MKEDVQNIKKRKKHSDQVREKIKKKPMSEEINNIQISYGFLKKKNQSFFLTNERLLILKGQKSIGYARQLPNAVLLPFYDFQNIPQLKAQIDLSQVSLVTAQNQLLTIEFIPQTKQNKWQFICGSNPIANDWKKLIHDAIIAMKMSSSNIPIEVNIPDPNNNNLQQNGYHTPQKGNNNYQAGSQNLSVGQNQSLIHQNGTNLSNIKSQLPTIIQQHQDNETQHPQNRDSHPFGPPDQFKQSSQFSNINMKPSVIDKSIDLKQQYLRKKKQQEKIKNSFYQNDKNYLSISTVSNKSTRNDKNYLDCNWDYQFIKGQSQYIIIQRFKNYVEGIIKIIIDQLSLQEKMRQYRPIQGHLGLLKYQIGNITIQIAFLQLNQVSTFQDRNTVVSNQRIKQLQQQFKNANYILQITRNRGRFRVPLMMLSQYKGFTALTKANIHTSNQYYNIQNSIQQDIQQLQRDTKISRALFEDQQNLKVLAADQKFFEKISRSENKFKKFDVCFLTEVNHFLPQDLYNFNRAGSTSSNKMRAEILQEEEYQDLLFNGSNLNIMMSRVKVPNETLEAINLLTEISKTIPERVSNIVQDLENLDYHITNSEQLSHFLHQSGVNIRYLGLIFDNAKQSWLKGIILAQIIARAAKYFLRYELQDTALNLSANSLDFAQDYHINQVLVWLNRIFGIGYDSQNLWRQIFRQALTYFKCSITRQNLNIGFLLQALQHHGRFKLQNLTLKQPFFKANNIFTKYHFKYFIMVSKTYDLSFTEHYSMITSKMQDLSYQSYEQVRSILNLQKREGLESHYYLNGAHKKLITYLVHWLSPSQASYLYRIDPNQSPSLHSYQIEITAIKWDLKVGKVIEAQKTKDHIIEHINMWLGECHPIISQVFDIFSRYYLSYREEEKRAVSYCRVSLKNQQKLLGGHHIKIADCYYNLGEIYLHYFKKIDALQCFKRASQILADNQAANTEPFVEIFMKISQILLANNAVMDALQYARQGLNLSEELKNFSQYLSNVELIARCYEISDKWQDYLKLSIDLIPFIAVYKDSAVNLERILKIIFMPIFRNIALRNRQLCKAVNRMLGEFPEKINGNYLAHIYLKSKIQQKIFPSIFLDYLDKIQLVLKEINSNNMLARWKGFQSLGAIRVNRPTEFLGILEALNNFLSGYFIESIFDFDQ